MQQRFDIAGREIAERRHFVSSEHDPDKREAHAQIIDANNRYQADLL
jgi:hypothetical protein